MKYFYSPSAQGFYLDVAHGNAIPADAYEITEAEWQQGVPPVFHEYTLADLQQGFTSAIQKKLDALAVSWGYDSMLSLVSYRDDPNSVFQAEALAGVQYRSAMWQWARGFTAPTVLPTYDTADAVIAEALLGAPPAPARPVV